MNIIDLLEIQEKMKKEMSWFLSYTINFTTGEMIPISKEQVIKEKILEYIKEMD